MNQHLFSLGELYVSDFLAPGAEPRADPYELELVFDAETHAVRLRTQPPPSLLWGSYWYRSGINPSMVRELEGIVRSVESVIELEAGHVWLDIASNDGTLLSFVPDDLVRIGIDPADDSFRLEALEHADQIIQAPFSADVFCEQARLSRHRADVITCIAMFYDLDDPLPFLEDVHELLEEDGLFVLQMSYTPLMIRQLAFDNICHEHVFYWSLETLSVLLERAGFVVRDCQLNAVNGGSFRVYAMKRDSDPSAFGTQPHRDVCDLRVESIVAHEQLTRANRPDAWRSFWYRLQQLREQVVSFIDGARADGASVWGYGASTKGNTLLQFFGLDHTKIDAIAERSPYKFGLETVGTRIPIVSEDEMREAAPDYLLVLPWAFISEFQERERKYLENGGAFIVPCPEFRIIRA